jgi:hypothetical protein
MSDEDIYKDCSVCGISMPLNKFDKQSSHVGGRNHGRKSACKECLKEKKEEAKKKKASSCKTEVQQKINSIMKSLNEEVNDPHFSILMANRLIEQQHLRIIELMATNYNSVILLKADELECTEQIIHDKLVNGGVSVLLANIKLVTYTDSYLVVITSGMTKSIKNILI